MIRKMLFILFGTTEGRVGLFLAGLGVSVSFLPAFDAKTMWWPIAVSFGGYLLWWFGRRLPG